MNSTQSDMSGRATRILIVAGEASGDLHGGNLVDALKQVQPNLEFEGVGGKHMRDAGVRTLYDIDRLGGMGFVEFVGGLWHHIQIFRRLSSALKQGRYQAAILINYPAFNLRLGKRCKEAGCPVYYFISPQVWASRKGRVNTIRDTGEKMYVILPFEEKIYQDAKVDVEYLGHPFVDIVKPTLSREQAVQEFELDPQVKTVGLFPGSRMSEINYLLDDMVGAARLIRKDLGECQFLLPVADTIDPELIRERLGDNPLNIRLVTGKNYEVMNCSDYLIMASGSATLEAGLMGCPMVIIYRVHPVTYYIAKALIDITHFGLINIVAGEEVVPELLNDQVTPEKIAGVALPLLRNPEKLDAVQNRLLQVKKTLGEPGVLNRVAQSIVRSLDRSSKVSNEKISL